MTTLYALGHSNRERGEFLALLRAHGALVARGHEVVQVLSATDARPHRLNPMARVRDGHVTYPGERPLDV